MGVKRQRVEISLGLLEMCLARGTFSVCGRDQGSHR